jgi:N-acetylglucosamine kinase-like BadF-type ATPase
MSNQPRFFIGVDGGGTQTTAVVVDENWRVRGQGSAAGSNYHTVGIDHAVAHIATAIDEALSAAGLGRADIAAAGFGLAGVRRPPDFERMTPRLQSLGFEKFHLDHDAAAAWAGALECQPGVIVIAGTGSIAFGVNAKGERATVGGWGWLLGDEGSGYSIGLSALRGVCLRADGRLSPSLLATAVLQHLGLSSADELVDYVYQQPGLSREQIAALTRVVLRCAEQGDVAAKRIFRYAGWQLAMTARAVMERLSIKGHCFISYTGGVWEAQAFVLPGFKRVLRGQSRKAQIIPPRYPPAVGAAMLARSTLCQRMGNE